MDQSLIEKYYSGACSEKEKLSILKYLRENPDAIDRYFTESEWSWFVQNECKTKEIDTLKRPQPILKVLAKRRRRLIIYNTAAVL